MYDDPLSIISFSHFYIDFEQKVESSMKNGCNYTQQNMIMWHFFVLCTHAPMNLLDGISAFSLSSAATEFVMLLLVCMMNGDKVCRDFDRIE